MNWLQLGEQLGHRAMEADYDDNQDVQLQSDYDDIQDHQLWLIGQRHLMAESHWTWLSNG